MVWYGMVWYGIGTQTRTPAAVRVSFGSLLVQREQWDTSWGPKKLIFLIRDVDDAAMAAAPAESCQFVVLRSPRGRLGSVRDTCNRLQRMRGRFRQYIHISTGPQPAVGLEHKSDNFSIQSSLGSSKYGRMRRGRLSDPRPIPEGDCEPIWIRKK